MIPYGRQSISDEDIGSVVEVLRSDFLTQGPQVERFEDALCEKVEVNHCIVTNSATSALHLACLALGITSGDRVWTSPITFVASANCALYCGADVDFVDIDPVTFNMSVFSLEQKLIEAKAQNKLPKLVIPVHLGGLSCDMERIFELSQQYNFKIVEDASHAVGGRYKGHSIGCCQFSDVAIFSFHPVKNMTTAEGGAALTNVGTLAEKIRLLRGHGVTRDQEKMEINAHGPWYYQQIALGYNYRLSDIHAALGVNQLKRLDQFVEARHSIAEYYNEKFEHLPLKRQAQLPDCYSALHLYIIQLDLSSLQNTHLWVFEKLRELGIGVNIHYIPVHTQPWYQQYGFADGDFPHAENYYRRAISLPIFPDMTNQQLDHVVSSIEQTLV